MLRQAWRSIVVRKVISLRMGLPRLLRAFGQGVDTKAAAGRRTEYPAIVSKSELFAFGLTRSARRETLGGTA